MKIIRVPISKCEPWEKNPRGITKQDFERLKKQIQELGVYKPLIACKENGKYIILGGNMRIRALKELGHKEVDVSIVNAPTEAEKIKYSLSDNDRAGYYEEEKLAELVYSHLAEINLDDFKIDLRDPTELGKIVSAFGPGLDDEADSVSVPDDGPAKTRPGDLFQLGRHRLLCGDSFKEESIKRLLQGKEIDIVITDPPYGIGIIKGKIGFIGKDGKIYHNIYGDDKPFNPEPFLNLGRNQIFFGANYFASKLPESSCWLVWDKREGGLKDNFADCELIWTSFDQPARIYRHLWRGRHRAGNRKEELKERVHPTQKPVGLLEKIILDFTAPGEIIFDPFLGSGTTIIAAEKTARTCFGIEIDPKYCDIIISRYADYVGIPEEEIRATVEHG